MSRPLALRSDFDGLTLRRLARDSTHARQARRLLALAEIYDGGTRQKAARIGCVGVQIVRDWVTRFNARGPEGLIDGKALGNQAKLHESHREALMDAIAKGPNLEEHGVVRWRLVDLVKWLDQQFGIKLDQSNVSRELKKMGYAKLSARPRHHAQDREALEAFKKGALQPSWRRSKSALRKLSR